jgi:hypothetical protein
VSTQLMIAARFYPNQANPARPSGRGVYRVVESYFYEGFGPAPRIRVTNTNGRKCLRLRVTRIFKKGSRIDPAKWVQ